MPAGGGRGLTFPVQRALGDRVDVTEEQDHHEASNHKAPRMPTPCCATKSFFEDHRPRIHENNLDIEKDEKHRDE